MSMKKLCETIKHHRRFLISTHVNPDPDALGSQLALADYLRAEGKQVVAINDELLPARFHFLPGARKVKAYHKNMRPSFDVALILDCGDFNRIGRVASLIKPGHRIVNIDHHITNHAFGDVNLVCPGASSTSEVIYRLLRRVGFRMTKNVALLLYVGIMTDTGSFRYDNTSAYTHTVVSRLMRYGFSVSTVYQQLYESIPLSDISYFTKVVSTFEPLYSGRVICLELPGKVLKKFSREFDLRDKIFRYLRAIKGAEVLVILTEIGPQQTRVNLRSQGMVNVAQIAHHFDGGGHRRAGGCFIVRSLPEARRMVLTKIRQAL